MLQLLVSHFHDPYLNLALENYFFEKLGKGEEILFLYVNEPSVVMGRFQNPWMECSPHKMGDIKLLRRQSGGGTVYHDRGNLNFSFIQNINDYDRLRNLENICRIMESCNVHLKINERHDLMVDWKGDVYKVSGSAFRHKKDKAFHHGTLLIASETDKLKASIQADSHKDLKKASGTASKRSPILNLNQLNPALNIPMILSRFKEQYSEKDVNWEDLKRDPLVLDEMTTLKSESWILGKTPAFTQSLATFHPPESMDWEISIQKMRISKTPDELSWLKGLSYGIENCKQELRERVKGQDLFQMGEDELCSRLLGIIL